MPNVIYSEPLVCEMDWFIRRGVPARMLDTVASGLITAFAATHPQLGEVLTERFFDVLRTHPMMRQPDARSHPRHEIHSAMREVLGPLVDIMGRVGAAVPRDDFASTAVIQIAFQEYAMRMSWAQDMARDNAVVFRILLETQYPSYKPPRLEI